MQLYYYPGVQIRKIRQCQQHNTNWKNHHATRIKDGVALNKVPGNSPSLNSNHVTQALAIDQ